MPNIRGPVRRLVHRFPINQDSIYLLGSRYVCEAVVSGTRPEHVFFYLLIFSNV